MELSGLAIGLASEGSFDVDPYTGMMPWNIEMLMLIDDRLGIEVVSVKQGVGRSGHLLTNEWQAMKQFAENEGFPSHHLVLRPHHQDDPRFTKGISNWKQLKDNFDRCAEQAENGNVFAEIDLRAFANPSRMIRIGEATSQLLAQLQSHCPSCHTPGFWVTERIAGLACSACHSPTNTFLAEVWQCRNCQHRDIVHRKDKLFAEPQHCAHCNP